MATHQIQSSNTAYEIGKSSDKYILGERAIINVSDGPAIGNDASFVDATIVVNGQLYSSGASANVITSAATGTAITVSATGVVVGVGGGIYMGAQNQSLVNHGLIDGGQGDGVAITADGAQINNTGRLVSVGSGAAIDLMAGGAEIENSGSLHGYYGINILSGSRSDTITLDATSLITALNGIWMKFGPGLLIDNAGRIVADLAIGVGNATTVVNTGVIKGAIELSDEADSFDNRGGTIDHSVVGGNGNDVLITDKASDYLFEGTDQGNDTVKSTVSYKLTDNVENLVLLGHANLKGTGNTEANNIKGNAGNNMLSGSGGADILNGHGGNDKLTGGGGADTFVFATGFDKDTIKHFDDGTDVVNLSGWKAIKDFDDLKHHLTVSGDDLVIKAGDDWLTIDHMQKSHFTAADVDFMPLH
jgi:Ca2+-binding RTX toxin-like protein